MRWSTNNKSCDKPRMESDMATTSPEENKKLVLKAFDALFNKRDYDVAERFWSENYIQHSAHIPPGRDGLFNLVRSLPDTLRYENHMVAAEGDYVIAPRALFGPWPSRSLDRRRCYTFRSSPSTGMFFRTRQRKHNRSAVYRCSATNFRPDR
jgi:SnoaL-like domain